ncbi:MAG TPA: glycosyltransferase family 2 protein [Vicinamibacterales bacterium]|nr:glycosyltransferase family 2 protein [Vicinamibacterales bacterium]
MTDARSTLSAVILTFNEARNIDACLERLTAWTAEVFVVDSGSTDDTVAIARTRGATVVTHPFETHAKQWRWALDSLPLKTDWVLALDADQRVTPELRDAIVAALADPGRTAVRGYFVNRRQIFRGRWIRYGGYYPKYLLKLFRRDAVSLDDADLVDHHFLVEGTVATLAGDMIEDNRNEAAIFDWTAKHNRYAVLQARQEIAARAAAVPIGIDALWGHPDQRVRWLKQQWARLPLFVRPCLYVFYRYVLRLGFLDGREGFIFHVLQGFWYRLLVDINVSEITASAAARGADVTRR